MMTPPTRRGFLALLSVAAAGTLLGVPAVAVRGLTQPIIRPNDVLGCARGTSREFQALVAEALRQLVQTLGRTYEFVSGPYCLGEAGRTHQFSVSLRGFSYDLPYAIQSLAGRIQRDQVTKFGALLIPDAFEAVRLVDRSSGVCLRACRGFAIDPGVMLVRFDVITG